MIVFYCLCTLSFYLYVTSSTTLLGETKEESLVESYIQIQRKRGVEKCNSKVFREYSDLHKVEKMNPRGKFLIYDILEDDVVGLGCRMSAAIYALALAVSTKRVLLLSGEEFKYIFSDNINFTEDYFIKQVRLTLQSVSMGRVINVNNVTYVKLEITQVNFRQAWDFYFGSTFSTVDILYTNNLASHRHIDYLLSENIEFRKNLSDVFGGVSFESAAYKREMAQSSRKRHLMVPEYPMFWRRGWGCAHWFLLNSVALEIQNQINEAFSISSSKCEKIVSIHFRMGDVSFSNKIKTREQNREPIIEQMIDRWINRLRTPLEVSKNFLSSAERLRAEWPDKNVCYFIASDTTEFLAMAKSRLDPHAFTTSGSPAHTSFSKSDTSLKKAIADYIVLGMADALVHGTSTLSESAIERSFGDMLEVKCRSPTKKLWSDQKSWYCIQKGKKMDKATRKKLVYIKTRMPNVLN